MKTIIHSLTTVLLDATAIAADEAGLVTSHSHGASVELAIQLAGGLVG